MSETLYLSFRLSLFSPNPRSSQEFQPSLSSGFLISLSVKLLNQVHIRELEEEVKLLKNLSHPNIVMCDFENVNVIHQLRCGGVLEAIRISCAGYPTNKSFTDFVNRFGLLVPEVLRANMQIGKVKVFLRAGHMAALDTRRAERLDIAIVYIQRTTRSYLIRKRFLAMANLAVALQTLCRGKLASKMYDDMKKRSVSLKIQTNFRRYTLRSSYIGLQHAVVLI
ncbi:putative myosin ATPase [Helianthus annuus]|nr:putative myosin ATPase [Helianthus annuus]